jgi:glycosyltransferase involved in cell wall biosynthesis
LKLLFISSFYLFKDSRFGGAKRLYYFAKEWEKHADMRLICMDACREWAGSGANGPEFKDFLMIPGTEAPGMADRLMRAPADRRRFLCEHTESIREFLTGERFDVVLLAFPWSLSFLGPLLSGIKAPVVFLEDDLVLEQFARAAKEGGLSGLLKRYRYRQTLGFYRPRMQAVSRFIGISPEEAAIMRELFPGLRGDVIKYGLPLSDFPFLPPPDHSHVIGFIGNYAHLPNLDAVEWMRKDLIPAIRSSAPAARFLIAGHGMTESMKRGLASDPTVTVRESIPYLADFYREITVFINPIRTGRGLRTKLIEAAAFGRPILTTSLGAEGLRDLEMEIADDTGSMADGCARLLAEGDRGRAARNRKTLEEHYALERVAADFLAKLEQIRT